MMQVVTAPQKNNGRHKQYEVQTVVSKKCINRLFVISSLIKSSFDAHWNINEASNPNAWSGKWLNKRNSESALIRTRQKPDNLRVLLVKHQITCQRPGKSRHSGPHITSDPVGASWLIVSESLFSPAALSIEVEGDLPRIHIQQFGLWPWVEGNNDGASRGEVLWKRKINGWSERKWRKWKPTICFKFSSSSILSSWSRFLFSVTKYQATRYPIILCCDSESSTLLYLRFLWLYMFFDIILPTGKLEKIIVDEQWVSGCLQM